MVPQPVQVHGRIVKVLVTTQVDKTIRVIDRLRGSNLPQQGFDPLSVFSRAIQVTGGGEAGVFNLIERQDEAVVTF